MSQSKSQQQSGDTDADQKRAAGPEKLAHELDTNEQWDDAAADKGYQKGDQGGYKGHYDETKYQQVSDKDVNPDEAQKVQDNAASTETSTTREGSDEDGRRAPLVGSDQVTRNKS